MCVCMRVLSCLPGSITTSAEHYDVCRGVGQRIYPCQENPEQNSPEGAGENTEKQTHTHRKTMRRKSHICQKTRSKLEIPFEEEP